MILERIIVLILIVVIHGQDDIGDSEVTPTTGNLAEEPKINPKNRFMELVRQRFEGNQVQQCPCVTMPGTDKCVAYDPRYAAVSIEEAIVAFADLTADNFETQPFRRQDYNCSSVECRQCAALLFYRLQEVNFVPENYPSKFSFDLPTLRELQPRLCKRLWLTRRRHLRAPPTNTPDYVRRMIEEGNRYTNDYSRFPSTSFSEKVINTLNAQNGYQYVSSITGQEPTYSSQTIYQTISDSGAQFPTIPAPPPLQVFQPSFPSYPGYYYPPSIPGGGYPAGGGGGPRVPPELIRHIVAEKVALLSLLGKKRRKRNTPDVSGKHLIGERFVISCVEKGDAESDEADFLNLCTACWAWRKLPDNYFPQIINELVCQENDFCLSGWGSCTQRYRHIDVLHRQNGTWLPTTVVSGACCDCKIRAGTEVHQLVIGNTRRQQQQPSEGIPELAYRETVDRNLPTVNDNIDSHPLPRLPRRPPPSSPPTSFNAEDVNIRG